MRATAPTHNIGRGSLLLRVRPALLTGSPARGLSVASAKAARIVCDLMIIHSHELIDEVAELRCIVDLVAPLTSHGALLVLKLLN